MVRAVYNINGASTMVKIVTVPVKKLIWALTTILLIGLPVNLSSAASTIKVGVYQDFPLVFYDQEGRAHGVYVDLLNHVAAKENWSVEYVPCKWVDCLSLLESGEIDLMTAIAFSKERTKKYDFNEETVFPNWGQVYTTNGIILDSIAELADKTVAGLEEDIYFKSLKDLTQKAQLNVTYKGVDEYDEVFRLLERNQVDAGILPRLYGDLNEKKFSVKKTTIIVRLSELRFAARKDASQSILDTIDKHLKQLKGESDSLYFQSVSRWLGQQEKKSDFDLKFSAQEKAWLADHSRILLGVDPEFVPFEFIDVDGSYRGMCADYVSLISERTGIAMDIAPNLSWNEAVERAKIKKIDVLPCVGMTEKRKEFLTYSNPHQTFYRVFVTKEGSVIGNSVDDLEGLQVAVQKNSSHHGFLQDNTDIKPILFDTAEEAINSVSEGRSDVFVGNENMTGYTINRKGIVNLKMTRLAGAEGKNLYFAVRNDWPELVSIINKGLASISEKEREAIKQKWIAVTVEKQLDYTLLYKIAAAVICFSLIIGLWNAQIRRQRKKLRESERRYRSLADNSEVGIIQITPDGTSIYLNPAMIKMIDAESPEQVIGKNIIDFIDPSFRDIVEKEREKRRQNISSTYEVELVGLKGAAKSVMISAAPIMNDAGKLESIISTIVDISALKQVENAYRESEAELRALFSGMTDVVIMLDKAGRYLKIAPTSQELLFNSIDKLQGGSLHDTFPGAQADFFLDQIQQSLNEQKLVKFEYKLEINGAERWFDGRIAPMSEDMVVFVARDITDHKNTEEALRKAKNEAESANLAKSTFLANMSHELRTPLNAILGFSGLMMRDSNLSEEQLSSLETIGRSGEHLLDLISDVLEFSKIEAGRVELQAENFDLYRLLFVIEEMFSLRAKEMGLILTVERSSTVPQYIHTDQGKLRQTLINILGNAVKFTPQGSIALRVRSEGARLFFEVEDTGVGIAREEIGMVFDVFVQSASGQDSKQGSGLGIPISQKFVRMMGGELTVESEVGKGTVFRFDIQVEIADGADHAIHEPDLRVVGLEPGQQSYRLLVVEDNEPSRKLLVTLLTKVGFEVYEAADGLEAIEAWKKWHPHLIWMDLRMPVLDGYEATERIRSLMENDPAVVDTKVIALTASAFAENKARAFESGCDDFVRKPFRESEIFKIMNKHLGVSFVYGDESGEARAVVSGDLMTATDLQSLVADLPPEIIERLRLAANSCDADRIDRIIVEIQNHSSELATVLSRLSKKFDYHRILRMLEKS